MSKAEKEAAIANLSNRIFASMLDDIVMDTVIEAQKEVRRSRNVCPVCQTRCGQAHTLPAPAPVPGSSRAPSPPPDVTGNSTPGSPSKGEGYLECVNCQKSLAYNRYAQHLAGCLGIGTGVRRTAQRNVAKTKAGMNGRSSSPYENADEPKGSKTKGRAKAGADEEANVGQKRAGTPQTSPTKKIKKKASALTGTGASRPAVSKLGFPGSNPKSSSKLRSTPTPSVASHVSKNSHSPSADSDSDAEGAADSGGDAGEVESHSSSLLSAISPSLPAAETIGRGRGSRPGSFSSVPGSAPKPKKTAAGTGPPVKKTLPAAPPPPVTRLPSLPPPPPVRRPESSFLLGDDGSETGSDTD